MEWGRHYNLKRGHSWYSQKKVLKLGCLRYSVRIIYLLRRLQKILPTANQTRIFNSIITLTTWAITNMVCTQALQTKALPLMIHLNKTNLDLEKGLKAWPHQTWACLNQLGTLTWRVIRLPSSFKINHHDKLLMCLANLEAQLNFNKTHLGRPLSSTKQCFKIKDLQSICLTEFNLNIHLWDQSKFKMMRNTPKIKKTWNILNMRQITSF